MPVWEKARVDTVYYDGEADVDDFCDVRIDGDKIVISYEGDNCQMVVWNGVMRGQGHFELRSHEVNGRATLHMFEGSQILEGYWEEDGYRGFWRINLR